MMKYLCREIYYWLVGLKYKVKTNHLKLEFRSKIKNGSKLEGYNNLAHHSFFTGEMGYGSYIGDYSIIDGKIGRYCSIAGNVVFLCKTHPTSDFVSTAPCFYSKKKQNGFTFVNKQKFDEKPCLKNSRYSIVVGNDVYIGYGVTIIGPVVIGDGAIIAANATVTRDVEPYTIVGGNPAHVIKKRFSDEEIEFLEKIKWWNKDVLWLRKHVESFESIDKLKRIKNIEDEI